MPLSAPVKEFLKYLQKNPGVRWRIAAPQDKTLLYAGSFFRPIWQEVENMRRTDSRLADKVLLPDVLETIPAGPPYTNLLAWAKDLDRLVPWDKNGFVAWRALSGIFASNAIGSVSFYVGTGITAGKVFAATELPVLARNSKLDPTTNELIAYYQRCIQFREPSINFGFIT